MQLKFIKQIGTTKYYSLRHITNTISLSVISKPELQISLWFEYKGIIYDHVEFVTFQELQKYVRGVFRNLMTLFFVSINDGGCTYAYIDRLEKQDKKVHTMKKSVQKVKVIDYDNFGSVQ